MQKSTLASSTTWLTPEALFAGIDRLAHQRGRSVPPVTTREQLQACPPHSLGRAWIDLVTTNNYPLLNSGPRRKQLHDAIHILTGYGTDDWGELEVQAFLLGCKFHLFHLPLIAGLLGRLLLAGELRGAWVDRVQAAYDRGRFAAPTFDPDTWPAEYLLDMPIAIAQDCLGILPD